MTNAPLVARKLAVLDDHVNRLRSRRPETLAALEANLLVQDAIAMSLRVAVQETMDIALHIASDESWELATTYREAFDVLSRHGVIEADLAAKLAAIANLRNRIAHGYATVDVARVWSELPNGVATFEAFAKSVASFLARAPSSA